MTKKKISDKKTDRLNCKKACNELKWVRTYPSNSEKIRQLSINPTLNSRLDDNGYFTIEYIEKNEKIRTIKINLHDYWHSHCFWPFEGYIVNYIRHQYTNYEIVIKQYDEKCYSEIRKHCLSMIATQYPCFKNECNNQRKQKTKNIERFEDSYKMPSDIRVAMICRIVALKSELHYDVIGKKDIIEEIKNKYGKKISLKDINKSINQKWIKPERDGLYINYKKYPIKKYEGVQKTV